MRRITGASPAWAVVGLAALLALALSPSGATAQPGGPRLAPRLQPEARADFIGARADAVHLGAGLAIPLGTYVRLALVGAAGRAWADDGVGVVAGRVDGLVRFVADPLRESRWAPYASGGIGALYDRRERWRAVLVGTLGIEGPAGAGVVPAVEIGFGGGARVGIVLRRAIAGRR